MADAKFTTALSQWTNEYTTLVQRDFDECGVAYSDTEKKCAMSAMTSIFQLMKDSGKDFSQFDSNSIRESVGQAASLQLNANAYPSECYFQTRNKKVGNKYISVVEIGVQGAGNDAILRNFGVDIERVYPVWIVHEGDEFTYPAFKGLELTPPEWVQKSASGKVDKIVYPIQLKDGTVQYLIAERESVKINLFAHIRNNLMNETFGVCENRYKATAEQKAQINAKKEEIYKALNECETLDDMLACEIAKPYISAAWLQSTENMVERKLRNNAIRKYPKDFNAFAKQSFMEMDDVYKASKEEIEEEANSEPFPIDIEAEVVDEQED